MTVGTLAQEIAKIDVVEEAGLELRLKDRVILDRVKDYADAIIAGDAFDLQAECEAAPLKAVPSDADHLIGLDSEDDNSVAQFNVGDLGDHLVTAERVQAGLTWSAFTSSTVGGSEGEVSVAGLHADGAVMVTFNTTQAPAASAQQLAVTVAEGKFTVKYNNTGAWTAVAHATSGWYMILDAGTTP